MKNPSVSELSEVRATVEKLTNRLRTDAEFTRALVNDPRKTLEENGIPPEMVAAIATPRESGEAGTAGIGCITTDCCFSIIKVCCLGTQSC